ncbi:MAG TPA: hypothetical protein VGT24_11625 [Candidatus Acidoferrales bacterium]|nr:hypothetical protein [Candidatus Acidoferrales bacterium]
MSNVKFNYLYRDASNFKKYACVIFSNPFNVKPEAISKSFEEAFWTDGLFIAHQIRIPEVFLFAKGDISIDDHCFHEFDSVELASDGPTDSQGRSIKDFVTEVRNAAKKGWQIFDPLERLDS